jgi:ribonuclease G
VRTAAHNVRREIVVNDAGYDTRVALLEDGTLVELMHERPDQRGGVGDIVLGKVEAVVPGLQAAFVDIASEKAAFLHASDLAEAEIEDDGNGDRRSRRYQPIQDVVNQGQDLLVQVTKEPIGTKGARVTTQVSLPGRFLVFMPFSSNVGISRKIEDRAERARLRAMARELLNGSEGGVIVRTVGAELDRDMFERELRSLQKTWKKVERRARSAKAPTCVHEEAQLTSGIIRDLFSQKVDSLTVDSSKLAQQIRSYLGQVNPELVDRVKHYRGKTPIFDEFGIEEEIRRAFRRKVELPSGGHIVIEQTEAMVSIDVNTGKYTGRKDPAKTILRTNMDAAVEICRQLRLRDVGGLIVADFIDMDDTADRDRVLQQMRTHIGRDRARTKVFPISDLGLMELSRQRVRPSLHQTLMNECPFCRGSGLILAPETVVRMIERSLRRAASVEQHKMLTIVVHPSVALYLLENERGFLREQQSGSRLELDVRDDPLLGLDEFRLLAGRADTDVTSKYGVR